MHAAESSRHAARETRLRYLPGLDGLRAVSVIAVIGFHADLSGLAGGFLGVEVFFVVSGYLITSLLLVEQRRDGTLSLPSFWRRRARRLLPALLAVLVTALILSITLAPDSLEQTQSDVAAALFYVSNWWQLIHHHSYFMGIDRPPLLLHLWSLSVEEQFYLFWPVTLALVGRSYGRWVLHLAIAGAILSALWMARLYEPSFDPTRVYIGSDTRASGLLLGAALAVVVRPPGYDAPATPDRPARRSGRELAAAFGALSLVWLFTHLTRQEPLLFRGGLLLVDLASCALIVGLVRPTAVNRLLGARPCAWLGRRSYGLYLWHWPVFAVTRPDLDLPLPALSLLTLRLGLTFLLAELCYRLIEMPVRRGALRGFRDRPLAWSATAAILTALTAIVFLVSGARLARARLESPLEQAPSSSASSTPRSAAPKTAELGSPPVDVEGALAPQDIPLDPRWPRTLTLLTDSVGLGLSRALPAALPGWKVEVLGRPALMVKQAVPEFLNARAVGSVVVVALGYNSLFEKERKDFARWSGLWDRGAEQLVRDLRACGAKKLVWVTLRDPSPDLVTDAGRDQFNKYAWFFPYVNERIRALATREPGLALADWQAVSNVPGITKDLIHLNPSGVALMTATVTRAVLGPPRPDRARP